MAKVTPCEKPSGLQSFHLRSQASTGEETEGLLGHTTLSIPPNIREQTSQQPESWCGVSPLGSVELDCLIQLFAMPGSTYMPAAESTLLQIINNTYVAVDKFLHIFFTIHPNHLTLTCESNGEYTL